MSQPTSRPYQRCVSCVMDTSDSAITFDQDGVCDFCKDYRENIAPKWQMQLRDVSALQAVAAKIKAAARGQKYDCILGMSGGVDSSYLCYVAKKLMGLNPLIYVVDTGWNLPVADENIKKIVKALDLDMHTQVIDWAEMQDLQLAFLKAQVPYQDMPQDHAIFAGLYNYAVQNNIKYVLTGANSATECLRPPIEWVYMNDLRSMRSIHKKFGTGKLRTFPQCSMVKYRLYYPILKGMKRCAPLDMVSYDKDAVKQFLVEEFGWEPYANKHYENVFTRFYEGYYLPHKFGFDKRKCYFSNEIHVGTMTREAALAELERPAYDPVQMRADLEEIAKKLGLTTAEFEALIAGENKTFRDYPNTWGLIRFGIVMLHALGIEKKKFR